MTRAQHDRLVVDERAGLRPSSEDIHKILGHLSHVNPFKTSISTVAVRVSQAVQVIEEQLTTKTQDDSTLYRHVLDFQK